MPAANESSPFVIEVQDLTKVFGRFTAVDHVTFRVRKGRDLRIPRSQWRGQVHHDPDAVRSALIHRRHGHGGRLRHQPPAGAGP